MVEILDPKLFLIVNEGNSRIAAYLGANGQSLEYALARNVTVANLRARPFILKGAFNNPLTMQATSSLRYSLNLDRAAFGPVKLSTARTHRGIGTRR